MEQNTNSQNPSVQPSKHMKSFWPLTIILVIAIILGGLVYWFKFNLNTDYDLQSMVITVNRRKGSETKTTTNQSVENKQQGTSTTGSGKTVK